MRHLLIALLLPTSALAGVDEVIDSHILPGYAGFAAATAALSQSAAQDCTAPALQPAYHAAFDAWMGVSHITLGPIEEGGLRQQIAFWPDAKNSTGRHLGALLAAEDSAVDRPESFAEVSIAARGLFALERMLYEADLNGYAAGSYPCHLVQAISADLAASGQSLTEGWESEHAETLRSAGAAGNNTYLSEREALQALYTALLTGLEFDKDARLAQPLGSFERPRPRRAEARRSGRSLRNVTLSLTALRDLAEHLTQGQSPQTRAAFDRAITAAEKLDDPVFEGVNDPSSRLKVEILQQSIASVSEAIQIEIGPLLGVSAGFNALDGD
ncbi:imelysin family protein [Alphaproteobacteria bacterium KMM 3653]|uniref:Imelysin family protein n=1 Tax=Harenicola maris TaxID=2841044 RepID=A0AAP2CVN2_9RHOB|nr:imelysin family protein [Harenicola maris]